MFDFHNYIASLTAQNKLAQEHAFVVSSCSGVAYIEGMLQQFSSAANFVCVSDTNEESLRQIGGGWFKRRVFTVFLLSRYSFGDMTDYHAKMALCRELYRQFLSRLLVDGEDLQNDMIYLKTESIRSLELGGYFLSGCTGLYFMLSMDEPTSIAFNADEWTL